MIRSRLPKSQRRTLTKIRCTELKKVINARPYFLGFGGRRDGLWRCHRLAGIRRRWGEDRSRLDVVQLGVAFVEVGLALLGNLVLVVVGSAIAVLVVHHFHN